MASPFKSRLFVLIREPVLGRVQSPFADKDGVARETSTYRATSSAILSRLRRRGAWDTALNVTPDRAVASPAWPAGVPRRAQGSGDLGDRLQRVMDTAPPGPVVVIGTEVPTIKPTHIQLAIKALGSHDAVLGPAPGGGYWLVGLKRRPRIPRAFKSVSWSSQNALEQTLSNLSGLAVAHVATLPEDGHNNWASTRSAVGRMILPPET